MSVKRYIATFHTHLSALRSSRALGRLPEVTARMAPVPRALSSSCGTCVRYEAEGPCLEAMDGDVDSVYLLEGREEYVLLHTNGEA